jgi:hypothetical protein
MRPEVERIEGNPRIRNVEPVKVTEQELNAATNESIQRRQVALDRVTGPRRSPGTDPGPDASRSLRFNSGGKKQN